MSDAPAPFRLKNRILLGYALPIVLIVAAAALVFQTTQDLEQTVVESEGTSDVVLDASVMAREWRDYVSTWRLFLITEDDAHLDAQTAGLARFQESFDRVSVQTQDPSGQAILADIDAAADEFVAFVDENKALVQTGRGDEARANLVAGAGPALVAAVDSELDAFFTQQRGVFAAQQESMNNNVNGVVLTLFTAAGLAVIVALAGAFIISSRTSRAINAIVSELSAQTSEIAATVDQHEQTASTQASSVNETTSTMEELDASARQTEEQASKSAQAADEATTLATTGSERVHETRGAMQTMRSSMGDVSTQVLSLSEQVNQIGKVTGLVTEIAERVNLLALNAAVEASRAGEHGRGFAVVAAEIRKLADRSRESADQISDLVGDIQKATNGTVMVSEEGTKAVEEALKLVAETAESFQGVTASVSDSAERTQQISLSARQMAAAIKQVVEAMNAINQGAQETAAGINETRSLLANQNENVDRLKAMV